MCFFVSDMILVDYVFPIIHPPILEGSSASLLLCDVTGSVSSWRGILSCTINIGLSHGLASTSGSGYDVAHIQAEPLRATAQVYQLSSSLSCVTRMALPRFRNERTWSRSRGAESTCNISDKLNFCVENNNKKPEGSCIIAVKLIHQCNQNLEQIIIHYRFVEVGMQRKLQIRG